MRKAISLMAVVAAMIIVWAQPGSGQPGNELKALRKDIETLKEGQKTIQKDLLDIKGLLRASPTAAAPAPAPTQEAVLNLDGAPVKGNKNAKVTLVDFTDYQ